MALWWILSRIFDFWVSDCDNLFFDVFQFSYNKRLKRGTVVHQSFFVGYLFDVNYIKWKHFFSSPTAPRKASFPWKTSRKAATKEGIPGSRVAPSIDNKKFLTQRRTRKKNDRRRTEKRVNAIEKRQRWRTRGREEMKKNGASEKVGASETQDGSFFYVAWHAPSFWAKPWTYSDTCNSWLVGGTTCGGQTNSVTFVEESCIFVRSNEKMMVFFHAGSRFSSNFENRPLSFIN